MTWMTRPSGSDGSLTATSSSIGSPDFVPVMLARSFSVADANGSSGGSLLGAESRIVTPSVFAKSSALGSASRPEPVFRTVRSRVPTSASSRMPS